MLPPRPGDDTLVLVDRRSSRADEAEASAALTGLRLDVIFPVLHGPYGEDGTIQGLLELANVAYVGCGVLASAVGMDKAVMKVLFRARGLPRAATGSSSGGANGAPRPRTRRLDGRARTCRIRSSSSRRIWARASGFRRSTSPPSSGAALDLAFEFDRKVIVEAAVPDAREIECAVLGNESPEASVPGEIVPSREFYDYEAKYIDGHSRLEIPAQLLDASEAQRGQAAGARRVRRDRRRGTRARRLSAQPRDRASSIVNEINTLPGFTTISMFSKLWAASGCRLSDARRSADRARDRASQREAGAQDDGVLSHRVSIVRVARAIRLTEVQNLLDSSRTHP